MSVKFPFLVLGGGGGVCRFYFYGRADFSDFLNASDLNARNDRNAFFERGVLERKALNRNLFLGLSNSTSDGRKMRILEFRCTNFLIKTRIWAALCTDVLQNKMRLLGVGAPIS